MGAGGRGERPLLKKEGDAAAVNGDAGHLLGGGGAAGRSTEQNLGVLIAELLEKALGKAGRVLHVQGQAAAVKAASGPKLDAAPLPLIAEDPAALAGGGRIPTQEEGGDCLFRLPVPGQGQRAEGLLGQLHLVP